MRCVLFSVLVALACGRPAAREPSPDLELALEPAPATSPTPDVPDGVAAQGPTSTPTPTPKPSPPTSPSGAEVFRPPAVLSQLTHSDGLVQSQFDLGTKLGTGRPVVLVFWAPGFARSERLLTQWLTALAPHRDQIDVYAVSGRRSSQVVGRLWESFVLAGAPSTIPLLVDDEFVMSKALQTGDVPNVTLFDGAGKLVFAKFKAPDQPLLTDQGRQLAIEIIAGHAAGKSIAVQRPMPYYASQRLVGRCAPAFTLPHFDSDPGHAAESADALAVDPTATRKRPLLILFWSSTCGHCRREIPQIVDYQRRHPKAFDIVSITTVAKDRPGRPSHRQGTADFIAEQKVRWPVLEDAASSVSDLYANVSLPTLLFVAPDGRITSIWYHTRGDDFDSAFAGELSKASGAQGCEPTTETRAPPVALTLRDTAGRSHELRNVVRRPTLVHFWATWCKPCVEELPTLLRYRDDARKQGLADVVFVSLDDPDDAVAKIAAFEQQTGLRLGSYTDPSGPIVDRVDLAYRLPRTWVVGPDLELLSIREGSQSWDDVALRRRIRARIGASANVKK